MKNVLIIASHAILPPHKSGSRLIYEFSRYLSDKYNVNVLHANEGEFDFIPTDKIKFYDFIKKGKIKFLDISFILKTIKLIKKEKIDIIIMEYPWLFLYVIIVKFFTNVKVIMHEHNIEYDRFKSFGKKWWKILYIYEKLTYRYVDDVFFITSTDKKLAETTLGVKDKGQICNYGIDKNVFNIEKNNEYKEELRKAYNIQSNTKIILFFGSFSYLPNIQAMDIIIKYIDPKLKEKGFDYKILICGGGLDKNIYKTTDTIIYTGFIPQIEMGIKGCDIMINPIISGGGVKTKVIESLACGKTIISTIKGAEGVVLEATDNKLITIGDSEWDLFVEKIIENVNIEDKVSEEFLNEYEWGNIINKLKI